jgi:Glyoxalase/Bleomycin resistance protein/Dioxygenase superfamily
MINGISAVWLPVSDMDRAVACYGGTLGLEDEVARLEDGGVEFSGEISEHPWGRIVPFKDPDGNDLQLYAPPA